MTPTLFMLSGCRMTWRMLPLPVTPAGTEAGLPDATASWPAAEEAVVSTSETLCCGLMKPDVSSMVPALCCARTRNQVIPKRAV